MSEVYFNGPLTICSGSQYRIRLEGKLRAFLGVERITGPLDPSIRECVEKGLISESDGETLLRISEFCDVAYTCPEREPPSPETIRSWSDTIDSL